MAKLSDGLVRTVSAKETPSGEHKRIPALLESPVTRTIVHGKKTYLLHEKLDPNPNCDVYRTTLLEEGKEAREVAIKRTETIDGPTYKLATRQLSALSKLDHPGIVKANDEVVLKEDGKTIHYLEMEIVPGMNIRKALQEMQLTTEQKYSIILQALEALENTHANEIIHRDIKPENIMVEKLPDGSVKATIIDFGVVVHVESTGSTLLNRQIFSIGFTAPELLSYKEATPASDLYSLTSLLGYILLDTKYEDSDTQTRKKSKRNQLGEFSELREFFLKGLEHDPEDRFQSALEMKEAILKVTKRETTQAMVVRQEQAVANQPEIKYPWKYLPLDLIKIFATMAGLITLVAAIFSEETLKWVAPVIGTLSGSIAFPFFTDRRIKKLQKQNDPEEIRKEIEKTGKKIGKWEELGFTGMFLKLKYKFFSFKSPYRELLIFAQFLFLLTGIPGLFMVYSKKVGSVAVSLNRRKLKRLQSRLRALEEKEKQRQEERQLPDR